MKEEEELDEHTVPLEAVRLFVLHGSLAEVGRQLNISVKVLTDASRQVWWQEEVLALRRARNAVLDAQLTKVHEMTIDAMIDRVEHGDKVRTQSGQIKRVPLKGTDLAKIGHTVFMERQLLRNEPTVVAGETGKVVALAEKLRALGVSLGAPDTLTDVEDVDASPAEE